MANQSESFRCQDYSIMAISRAQEIIEAIDDISNYGDLDIPAVLGRINAKVGRGTETWQTVMNAARSVFPDECQIHIARIFRLGKVIGNTKYGT